MWLMVVTGALSVAVVVLGGIAWRQFVTERRRSEARIAALARAIDDPAEGTVADAIAVDSLARRDRMALTIPEPTRLSRAPAFAVAVLVVLGTSALLVAGMGGGRRAPDAARPAGNAAIELLSMHHVLERETLIVSGVLRNASGLPSPPLSAVLSVIGQDGAVIARRESPLEPGVLAAGKETSFRVSVADVADPSRYRVAFSSGHQIVPHVDRRADRTRAARASAASGK